MKRLDISEFILHNGGKKEENMAYLNIKNFPGDLYRKLSRLAKEDKRSTAQEVIHLLEESLKSRKVHHITELKGLGKEIWKGIDVEEFLTKERHSWK